MDLGFIDFHLFIYLFILTGTTGNDGLMKVGTQSALTSCLCLVAWLVSLSVLSTKALH